MRANGEKRPIKLLKRHRAVDYRTEKRSLRFEEGQNTAPGTKEEERGLKRG